MKKIKNTRILSINPNSFRLENEEKIHQIKQYCNQYQIEIVLLCKTNMKWIIYSKERMKQKLKELGKIELIHTDSKEYEKAKKNYLPGGIMNLIRGSIISLYD